MTEPATIFDSEDAEAEERALREAEAQLDAGQGVPHEVVRAWLQDLATPNKSVCQRKTLIIAID